MNLDDPAIGVMEKDLIPTSQRPLSIIGIGNSLGFQPLLEAFDVVGAETEMASFQWIDELFHLEPEVDILPRNVKLDGAIGQKIDRTRKSVNRILSCQLMFVISHPAQAEHSLVKFRGFWYVFRTQIHVVIVEVHAKICLSVVSYSFANMKYNFQI